MVWEVIDARRRAPEYVDGTQNNLDGTILSKKSKIYSCAEHDFAR
jgi:hypothetical protein